MTQDREQRIQERAYAIWEAEGRPEGRERDHWQQAEHELAALTSRAVDPSPAPSPVKKTRKPTAKASTAVPRSKKKAPELRP
jgi:hypothetical protein